MKTCCGENILFICPEWVLMNTKRLKRHRVGNCWYMLLYSVASIYWATDGFLRHIFFDIHLRGSQQKTQTDGCYQDHVLSTDGSYRKCDEEVVGILALQMTLLYFELLHSSLDNLLHTYCYLLLGISYEICPLEIRPNMVRYR